MQMIQNRFIGFGDGFFNVVDFQRPDRISGSFPPAFKLAGLVETADSRIGGKPFFRAFEQVLNKAWKAWKERPFL